MSLAQSLLRRIPQYTRNQRHFWSLTKHGSPRKWTNLFRAEYERKARKLRVKSLPYLLIIDPCNFCNLKCPLCPTGINDLGRPQAMLSFEHFQAYFDPLAPYLFEAYLHNWGESLLNKQVFRMIEHAQRNDVGTNMSSNFYKVSSDDIDKLLDCGLEYLVISLDGTSQDTYGQYRIGGQFDTVMANLQELIRRRSVRRQKTPVIEWQFIVMKQNEHQVQEAEVLAKKIGVDLIRFIPVGMPFEVSNRKEVADQWYPSTVEGRVKSDHSEQQFGQAGKPAPCFYLYRSMVVNPDGGVSPCCVVYKKHRDFAKLDGKNFDLRALWNNDRYVSARSLYSAENPEKHFATVCDVCDIFARHPSKVSTAPPPIGSSDLVWPAAARAVGTPAEVKSLSAGNG